jgi:long-subunit fatty acid transport protein
LAIERITIGAQHQLNDQWAVSANLAWINSELYDGLTQRAPPDIIVPVVWDDTARYILGVCFTPADRWAVRAKVFLDKPLDRPFIDFSYGKDHAMFDQGRLWLAATVDYHIRNDLSFDLEYARVSLKDGGQRTKGVADDASETENAAAERGTSIDLFSASLTIQF